MGLSRILCWLGLHHLEPCAVCEGMARSFADMRASYGLEPLIHLLGPDLACTRCGRHQTMGGDVF